MIQVSEAITDKEFDAESFDKAPDGLKAPQSALLVIERLERRETQALVIAYHARRRRVCEDLSLESTPLLAIRFLSWRVLEADGPGLNVDDLHFCRRACSAIVRRRQRLTRLQPSDATTILVKHPTLTRVENLMQLSVVPPLAATSALSVSHDDLEQRFQTRLKHPQPRAYGRGSSRQDCFTLSRRSSKRLC